MAEDHPLELPELGARSQAQLVAQQRTCLAVGGERLGLASRPIQREHQLRAQSLLERRLRRESLQLDDHVGRVPEGQLSVNPLHLGEQAELLQTPDLGLHAVGRREVGERRPAPQAERFGQPFRGSRRVALREQPSSLLEQ